MRTCYFSRAGNLMNFTKSDTCNLIKLQGVTSNIRIPNFYDNNKAECYSNESTAFNITATTAAKTRRDEDDCDGDDSIINENADIVIDDLEIHSEATDELLDVERIEPTHELCLN